MLHVGLFSNGKRWLTDEGMFAAPGSLAVQPFNSDQRAGGVVVVLLKHTAAARAEPAAGWRAA